jgi:hypothetical protein
MRQRGHVRDCKSLVSRFESYHNLVSSSRERGAYRKKRSEWEKAVGCREREQPQEQERTERRCNAEEEVLRRGSKESATQECKESRGKRGGSDYPLRVERE